MFDERDLADFWIWLRVNKGVQIPRSEAFLGWLEYIWPKMHIKWSTCVWASGCMDVANTQEKFF